MRSKITTCWLLALALLAGGCSSEIRIESNTSWSGSFCGRTIEGTGNKTIEGCDCATVQKTTADGYLEATIHTPNSILWFGLDGESKRTEAAYGVVSVCQ